MSASTNGHGKVVDTLLHNGAKVDWKKEVNSYFGLISASFDHMLSQLWLQLNIIIALLLSFNINGCIVII